MVARDQIRQTEQGMGQIRRFLFENIQARAIEVAAFERPGQGVLIDQAAARHIDQHRPARHGRQPLRVDHMPGLFRQRHMQGDDIGLPAERCEVDGFDISIRGGHVGIVDERSRKAQPRRLPVEGAPDTSVTANAEGASRQPIHRFQARNVPRTVADVPVAAGDPAHDRHQQGKGLIADFLDAVIRHVGDFDAFVPRRREVHIVHARTVTDDHLAAGHSFDGGPGEGRFPQQHRVSARDGIGDTGRGVTARTSSPHIKVFREERERPVVILCDLRASMHFGTRRALKSVVAADIAALFAWSTMANGDRVGGLIFNDTNEIDLRPHSGRKPLMSFLHQLGEMPESQHQPSQERMLEVCRHMSRVIRPGSAVYMISDFQGFDEACERTLYSMCRHSDFMAVHISDPFESKLPSGQFTISDGQHKRILKVSKQEQLGHQEAWQQHIEMLKQQLLRHKSPLTMINTADDPLEQLRTGFGFTGAAR